MPAERQAAQTACATTLPTPNPAVGEETTARAAGTLPVEVATNQHLSSEAARTARGTSLPAPDPDRDAISAIKAGSSLCLPPAAGQPPAALLALLADPAVAAVADTGTPHVLVPASLLSELVAALLMFVNQHEADPAAWPDADVPALTAAHAVLARAAGTNPIADAPAG